jgi:hypothetical protein
MAVHRVGFKDRFPAILLTLSLLLPLDAGAGSTPDFEVPIADPAQPLTFIAYGDTRFSQNEDPWRTVPAARLALVARIARERPVALFMSGDLPLAGGTLSDYEVYRRETVVWRDAQLRVFPALGNHELSGCELAECLENWWSVFPELRGTRWYSVALGDSLYALSLDSNSSLLPGSAQREWFDAQIAGLPASVRFVLVSLHHPPVADVQKVLFADHNPRMNEESLTISLKQAAASGRVRFVVVGGHIHNYERFLQDGVTYIVSGGGGAPAHPVDRTDADLYRDPSFPNYHYLRFTLQGQTLTGTMVRLADARVPAWEERDHFVLRAP